MVVLTESGLNRRHKELNQKVIEAFEKNLQPEEVNGDGPETDVDVLFKIDLASKRKDVNYILEVIKSSDSIFAIRALKCSWLYDAEFKTYINPQYINDVIFPHLSLKLKRKFLNSISVHLRDIERSLEFYNYCKTNNYSHTAVKFLIYASEETKLKELSENPSLFHDKEQSFMKNFIGSSFALTKAFIEIKPNKDTIFELRYLYFVNDIGEKYLDVFDDNKGFWKGHYYWSEKFSLRMSKDIVLKHKHRIYQNPLLYTNLINQSILLKYSTVEDAKYYITALLPDDVSAFWVDNYYKSKKHFFDMIPKDEKYLFIKKIFNEKYPGVPFEMSKTFYDLQYYELIIDPDVRENWALEQINSNKEVLGSGQDFNWYKFIKFEKAFDSMKKYISITSDSDKRSDIMIVLIQSAKTCRDLEKLFNYYYERHINEHSYLRKRFVDTVDNRHNIFEFDLDCFNALDKIYYSLEVYNVANTNKTIYITHDNPNALTISLVYRIINKMEMPECFFTYLNNSIEFRLLKIYTNKLTAENRSYVFDYIMEYYTYIIQSFDIQDYERVKCDARKYIEFVIHLMQKYKKSKEEIPEIIMKYVRLDWDNFKLDIYINPDAQVPYPKDFTQNDLLRCLKKDSSEFIDKLSVVKTQIIDDYFMEMSQSLVRKLRLYFTNDLAKKYFEICKEILRDDESLQKHSIKRLVFIIIQLADRDYLLDFMTKHVPSNPKIDYIHVDDRLLYIQKFICSYAGHARPPVPLALILKYLKGDYTKFCLPLFNMFLANLPPTQVSEFITSTVDAPVSIQKHGLRLAFKCISNSSMKTLVTETWRQTRNVSLRLIIYKLLWNKLNQHDDGNRSSIFEILNNFTTNIYEEDDAELFCLITSGNLPKNLLNEHLKTVYATLEKLPFKTNFMNYRCRLLVSLEINLDLIEPITFIQNIINEHVQYVFNSAYDDKFYLLKDSGLLKSKWSLTAEYVLLFENKLNLEYKLNLVKLIISKCAEKWNVIIEGKPVYRNYLEEFLCLIKYKACYGCDSYKQANIILECIINNLENLLPAKEIYITIWDLRLNLLARNCFINANDKYDGQNIAELMNEAVFEFGKDCGALILEYIEKNMFWIMFEDTICKLISDEVENIRINFETRHKGVLRDRLPACDILLHVVIELTEFKIFEILSLAVKLVKLFQNGDLPCALKNKLNSLEDKQLECFVYQKLNKNDQGSTLI